MSFANLEDYYRKWKAEQALIAPAPEGGMVMQMWSDVVFGKFDQGFVFVTAQIRCAGFMSNSTKVALERDVMP